MIYQLHTVQKLPISLDEAWDFFSSPYNLKEITPTDISFDVLSDMKGVKMYSGMIIRYRVKPLLGISVEWMSEITHLQEKSYFVDEQRSGPFALWHHQHHFKAVPEGVEMTDIVDYKIPLGVLGRLAHWLFVKRQLEGVFSYRKK